MRTTVHAVFPWMAAVLLVLSAGPLAAQQEGGGPGGEPPKDEGVIQTDYVTFDVKAKALADVLAGIASTAGKNVFYEAKDLQDIQVTLKVTRVYWKKVIEILAERYNLNADFGTDDVKITRPPLVTMELQDADVRNVINLIAVLANRNVVFGTNVRGTVNLRLKDVPWNEALEAIASSQNLVVIKRSPRVYHVIPAAEARQQKESQIFQLKYIRPREVFVPTIQATGVAGTIKPPTEPAREFTLLQALQSVKSSDGAIQYDQETNSIFATDIKPKLEEMQKIISTLDVEPQQVFVDVKFIQTSNTDFFDFGWDPGAGIIGTYDIHESLGFLRTKLPFVTATGSVQDSLARRILDGLSGGSATGGPHPLQSTAIGSTPTAGILDSLRAGEERDTGLSYGVLQSARAQSTLRVLKRDTFTQVVQAPKILTLDNREATIFVGRELHFHQTSLIQNDNGTVSIELKEAEKSPVNDGFQLLLVPHIIPGTQKMILTVIPNNRRATSKTILAGTGATQTSLQLFDIDSQSMITHILMESGQTAVIGGLVTVGDTETIAKIPFLGDIPLIGYLFKNKQQTKIRSDLLIFITPRIVASPLNVQKTIDKDVEKARQKTMNELADLLSKRPVPKVGPLQRK